MAGFSHPGELTGDTAWLKHGALMARVTVMVLIR